MADDWLHPQNINRVTGEFLNSDFAVALQATRQTLEPLSDELKRLIILYEQLRNELSHLQKIVKDGNGQPALTAQVLIIQERIKHLDRVAEIIKQVDHITIKVTSNEEALRELKDQAEKSRQLKWAVWIAVASAIIGLIGSVLQLLFSK